MKFFDRFKVLDIVYGTETVVDGKVRIPDDLIKDLGLSGAKEIKVLWYIRKKGGKAGVRVQFIKERGGEGWYKK